MRYIIYKLNDYQATQIQREINNHGQALRFYGKRSNLKLRA